MAYKDKAQAVKVQNDWIKNTYDRINLTVPKGDKEKIAIAAAAAGQSVNAFINEAIKEKMEKL
jgi:predicted HicB family RNase H-like nuclease